MVLALARQDDHRTRHRGLWQCPHRIAMTALGLPHGRRGITDELTPAGRRAKIAAPLIERFHLREAHMAKFETVLTVGCV
jgi:hypothetical protein